MSESPNLPTPDESQLFPKDSTEEKADPKENTNQQTQKELPPLEPKIPLEKVILKPHPKCLLFPKKSREEMAHLKENMVQRHEKGLPPLEQPILLLDGFILDGRHRYEAWHELAAECASDGWFAKETPPTEIVQADDEAVALRIASRNLSQRNLSADQRAAIWIKLVKETPSLRAKLETREKENEQRMKSGKPKGESDQGCSTNEYLAVGASVSPTVMKMVRRIEKEAPEDFEKLAEGTVSSKKVLSQLEAKKKPPESKAHPKALPKPQSLQSVKIGDKVFTVRPYDWGDGDIYVEDRVVTNIVNDQLHFEGNNTKDKSAVYSREEAEKRRKTALADTITTMETELAALREKLNPPPKKSSVQRPQSRVVKRHAKPKGNALQEPAPSSALKVL